MGLHVFNRAIAAHFGGDDADEVFLQGKLIYQDHIGAMDPELENAAQRLVDALAPMKSAPRNNPANENSCAHEAFLEYGAKEGRNPSALFNTAWYLGQYPDVATSGINPLVHYIRHGPNEGRQPIPFGASLKRELEPHQT